MISYKKAVIYVQQYDIILQPAIYNNMKIS
jgi:hypothetical protein